MLCAFDVIEINGHDLRRQPIEDRKLLLKELLRKAHPGIAYNRHFDVEGGIVFHHASKLGCEGIVSKRLGSPYTSGRVNDWLKIKNPSAPAVRRSMSRGGEFGPVLAKSGWSYCERSRTLGELIATAPWANAP